MTDTYGLLLRTEMMHGYVHVVAEMVRREGEHHAPRNISDDSWSDSRPKHLADLALNDLRSMGFYSKSADMAFIGYEFAFCNVTRVTERLATRMARTLKRINDRTAKDDARTPCDHLAAMCAALRLDFVVIRRDAGAGFSSYDDNQWRWLTIGEGRNAYRDLIERNKPIALEYVA